MAKYRKTGRQSASIAGDLMLAPMVALMRLPLMAADASSGRTSGTETELAVSEKTKAIAEGVFAAQMSMIAFRIAVLAGSLFGPDAVDVQWGGRGADRERGAQAGEPAREGQFQKIVAAGLIRQKPRSEQEHGFATDTHGPSPTLHCDGNGSGTRDLIRSVGRMR